MSAWQGNQELPCAKLPSQASSQGGALLVLGQWALERGRGGLQRSTEQRAQCGPGLLGADQLQLAHWQELGWGGVGVTVPRPTTQATPRPAPVPLATAEPNALF